MIGLDWGTTSLRAYRLAPDGTVLDRLDRPGGIMTVAPGGFPAAMQAAIGPWLAAGETAVVLCGMVGSRQGWVEAPYLPCPAGAAELAAATIELPFARARARLIPGLTCTDAQGVPDVMRGEETKLVALAPRLRDALVCLPGTHAKWARIEAGRISGFTTHMTGEVFAALSQHTILARTSTDAPHQDSAFARGVAQAQLAGGLLHHLFGARTLHLMDRLPASDTRSYLSGLLIGHEVAAALAQTGATQVDLVGADALAALYRDALQQHGIAVRLHEPDLVAAGLHAFGSSLGWN